MSGNVQGDYVVPETQPGPLYAESVPNPSSLSLALGQALRGPGPLSSSPLKETQAQYPHSWLFL